MAERICGICHEDCSERPRIKDPKGRYFCRACYDEAVAARKEREAPAPDDGALSWMDEITPAAPAPMPTAAASNWDARKKSVARASRASARAARREERVSFSDGGGGRALAAAIILAAVWALGAYISFALDRVVILHFMVLMASFYTFAYGIWILVAAAMERGIVEVILCFIPFWALYFIFWRSENAALKAGFVANIGAAITIGVGMVNAVNHAMEQVEMGVDPFGRETETFGFMPDAGSEFERAIAEARNGMPYFEATFNAGSNRGFGFHLCGFVGDGPVSVHSETAWVEVQRRTADGSWVGRVSWDDQPYGIGTEIEFPPEAIVDYLIHRCIAADADARFADAKALRHALGELQIPATARRALAKRVKNAGPQAVDAHEPTQLASRTMAQTDVPEAGPDVVAAAPHERTRTAVPVVQTEVAASAPLHEPESVQKTIPWIPIVAAVVMLISAIALVLLFR